VRRRRGVGTTRLGSLARSGPLRGRSGCAGLAAMFTLAVARGDSSCSMLEWDTKVGLVGNGAGRGDMGMWTAAAMTLHRGGGATRA
jgi:hypothetical protein